MQDKLLAQHCIPSVLSTRASCDLSKYPREEWTVAQSLSPFPVTLRENRPTGLVSECVSSPVPPARCCARLCLTLVAPASLGCWWQPPSSVPRPPYRLQGKRRVGLVPQTQRKGPGTPSLPGAVGPRSGGTGPPGTFITNSRSSLRLTSIEFVMPSSHLILCCPLLLLPPNPSQHQSFPMSQLFA